MQNLSKLGRQFNRHAGIGFMQREHFLDRALEELAEARAAVTRAHFEEELADVLLVMASMADALGLDLDAAVTRKHHINLAREWQPHPTIPGAVKHVKKPK